MKRFVLFCTIFLIATAGCTAASTPPPTQVPATEVSAPKEVGIAVLIPVLGNSYCEALVKGVKDTASRMGATVDVYSADYDAATQVQQLEDAVTSGKFNAFIIDPVDSMNLLPDIQDAAKTGIAIGTFDAIVGPNLNSLDPVEGVNVVVAVTGEIQGMAFGEKVVEACGDLNPCKVLYMSGFQQLMVDQERARAFHAVVDKYPQIEVVAEQESNYLQDKGFDVTQNILQSHPDINVIISVGDQSSLGAAQAVADAGLSDKVIILGNGASVEGVKAVQDGTFLATYAILPFTEGQIAAEWVIRAARGEAVHQGIDMTTVSPPLPATGPWITKDSADTFEAQW
jgi:ribose transport system substrate-binding protein